MRYKGLVVWDLNGTLVDDLAISWHAACKIIQHIRSIQAASKGLPSLKEYREWVKKGLIEMYHFYGVPEFITLMDTDGLRCHYYKQYKDTPKLRNQAHQVVQFFHRNGITQAIVSADVKRNIEYIEQCELWRLDGFIDRESRFGACFPKDDQVCALAQEHGVPMNKVVCVGDTVSDIEMAHRVGALSIGFMSETSYSLEADIVASRPHAVVGSMADVSGEARRLLFG
jgi:phosphoglycolate phosphatase-like HAD superfamily hydrolase